MITYSQIISKIWWILLTLLMSLLLQTRDQGATSKTRVRILEAAIILNKWWQEYKIKLFMIILLLSSFLSSIYSSMYISCYTITAYGYICDEQKNSPRYHTLWHFARLMHSVLGYTRHMSHVTKIKMHLIAWTDKTVFARMHLNPLWYTLV